MGRMHINVTDTRESQRRTNLIDSYVTTDGQSSSLSCKKHPSGAYDQIFIIINSCVFFHVGRYLWRDDGSVIYNCCWTSPAQSWSSPSPLGLVIIFHSLRFETSLFTVTYDSQGYGGDNRTHLHTGSSTLFSLPTEEFTRHGPHRKHNIQHFFFCCMCIRCL
jgi:hypothetical protein